MTSTDLPTLICSKRAAHILNISVPTLERLRRAGRGPAARKIGRKYLYTVEDLRAFVAAMPTTTGQVVYPQ